MEAFRENFLLKRHVEIGIFFFPPALSLVWSEADSLEVGGHSVPPVRVG